MPDMRAQPPTEEKKIGPAEKYGLQVISMGFLTSDDAPIIWRGPMLHGALQQFFREVRWGNLDYLVDRKSTRLNSSHTVISYAVFCLKKKKNKVQHNVNA